MEIVHYEKEFVERTRLILQEYAGEYKLTNAINCMLGLLVLPNEMLRASRNPVWDCLVSDIEDLGFLQLQVFEPIQSIRAGQLQFYPKTLRILMKKIRNGIAHQRIDPINHEGLFTGIRVLNYFGEGKNRHLDLDAEFDRPNLEHFAFFVANAYLQEHA